MSDTYIAVMEAEPDGRYTVEFPDLPDIATFGDDFDDARVAAADALALHLRECAEQGEPIPAPSSLDRLMASGMIPAGAQAVEIVAAAEEAVALFLEEAAREH